MERKSDNSGLVLEGGGLRGVYTSGVLRVFMERELYFPWIAGVSMGACNAVNYLSRQKKRNRIVNMQFVRDRRYLSYRRLLFHGELFGMDFIFGDIPKKLVPFDYRRFEQADETLLIVASDCMRGEAVYFDKSTLKKDQFMTALRASCSLPFLAKPVMFCGKTLMDGGVTDPVPLHKSIEAGNTRHVLILTRPAGYRKKALPLPVIAMARLRYPKRLAAALEKRHIGYNHLMDEIDAKEASGEIFVIRPKIDLHVGKAERDARRLNAVYQQGMEDAGACFSDLEAYLKV